MEANVFTYSSAISVCDKAGSVGLALGFVGFVEFRLCFCNLLLQSRFVAAINGVGSKNEASRSQGPPGATEVQHGCATQLLCFQFQGSAMATGFGTPG